MTSNKLIVRNLAFQATKSELKGLFAAFGAVQRVRIPKKMGGVHRGFAFIDFSTSQEAATAMAALTSAHLYGRHLVIEYAKDDEEVNDLDQLRKRAKVDEKSIQTEKKRRLLTDVTGATPANVARRLVNGPNTRLVAGVNLPMLLRTVCYRHESLDQLTERAMDGGTQGVCRLEGNPVNT